MYPVYSRLKTSVFKYIFLSASALLAMFTLLRVALIFCVNASDTDITTPLLLQTLKLGWYFDAYITAYFISLPVILYVLFLWLTSYKIKQVLTTIISWYIIYALPLLFFIAIADIPYFLFFHNRLTETSLQWLGNTAIVIDMLTSNKTYLSCLVFGLIFGYLIGFTLYIKRPKVNANISSGLYLKWYSKLVITLVLISVTFLGMRGRIDRPLREGDAFFCDNTTINQLGLNAIFTLIKSYEAQAHLMDDELAISQTKAFLAIQNTIDSISPIARLQHVTLADTSKPNVVLVLMESMSAAYMQAFGNTLNLTPNLDSLSKISWHHTNMYSAGIHTNNGVFSTLYSYPAIKRTRPMSTVPLRAYSGLPYTLKQLGYETVFFTTHNKSFDNLETFIPFNSFDELYSEENYDKDAILGPFGVADDYLFSFATNKLTHKTKPFFATILTTSNHEPYTIPKTFTRQFNDESYNAVNYSDWSIGEFLNQCSKQDWYTNTIFIFVADHGLNVGQNVSGFALNYHHIPLLIHFPKTPQPKVVNDFVLQVDVFPYIMSLLQQPFVNNTLGVSPLIKPREMAYFSADDKLAALSTEWLYVYFYSGKEFLFKRNETSSKNYISDFPNVAAEHKNYAFSQTQTAEWLFRNNKTAVK
jgi:phosphoglycerol transferase MdoB-like AlkP superfamily enzyme